ncbi:uncharacterized protein EI90DRAFT_3279504 [Cantharellus anzutake]|uniref:uncharacterized protein n=1 Tax=Cantharellus anzutake TaxID=1750568 RepID=UPI0019067E44|nr:uncharacterized protein EI90DRAFT_3279504 [Cantharellus anzutake]KAF8339147.1 hypothetical protein EI90DRAFT_3279504 [Cantharellus anzutake]
MLPFALGWLVTLFLWDSSLLIGVVALPHASRSSSHLRKRWYHDQDHPVHALFKRQDPNSYPPVGSSEWKSSFPDPSNFPPRTLPKAWTDALNASIAAGKIPHIPISTLTGGGSITYPSGSGSPTGPTICSAYYECRAKGDLWDAPTGQQQPVTHFFIGGNIYLNWKIFLQAFQDNQDDIAVHTYTHPHMSTLSNERVLAELGYTMQIIHDSTGGRVPRFWRPPYGDCDNRVRAIAREIFGLTTVVWNHDTSDWQLTDGTISYTQVQNSLKSFYSSPKSPGLVILEHELSALSVQAFIWSWPLIGKNGWTPVTIADAAGTDWSNVWHVKVI